MAQRGAVGVLGATGSLWQRHFVEACEREKNTSGTNPGEWRAGGRATKALPNKEDGTFWVDRGEQMVTDFISWWTANNDWTVWKAPDGKLGVEIPLFSEIGGAPVRAYADLIAYDQDGVLSVVDLKTGSHMPDSGMQLGLYAVLCDMLYGVRPTRGYFYDARNATMVQVNNMNVWTKPVFDDLFKQFVNGLEAEIFLPNIGMMCKSCSVNQFCYVYGGELSQDVDPLSLL